MKNTLIAILAILSTAFSFAQTGVIKGNVIDEQSEVSLPGVNIELLNTNIAKGVITDFDGFFRIENVPVGRQTIRISFIGYETVTIPNIEVTSGKDAVVTINLIEAYYELDEVILTPNKDRSKNRMVAVSSRQFSLEEVTRFSGGRNDVARLAANFAGVSAPDDSRNDIVVRGNSPTGLLWQLEGIPIPSPNHFSTFGTTGGAVSALNSNMLKNSDFITSAFPAEYGNALGGVFDLSFRRGNIDDYEYTFQIGSFSGVEAMAEGPLGKNSGSFLVAGRYSLVGLLGVGGTGGTSAVPNYNDISFNINFGKSKFGTFSLFGIIGSSNIDFLGEDFDNDDLFSAEDEDTFVTSGFGVVGIKHRTNIGENSYIKTIIAGSFFSSQIKEDRYFDLNTPQERKTQFTEIDDSQTRLTFSTSFNSKLSNKATIRAGILVENYSIESLRKSREEQFDSDGDGDPDLVTFRDSDQSLSIIQPYIQGQFRASERLILNAGVHTQYSTLNKQFVLEPRAAINWKIAPKHSLSLGYGLHHQSVPFPLLFLSEDVNGELVQTNKDLDFVQSNHFVIGYDIKLANNWRGKLEVYYQDITNAAVESFPSSYSSLTEGADFGFDDDRVSLINKGTGYNQGIELTLEKFFSRGYYGLLTASFFESKYEGSDGVERNTPFNNEYVMNVLAGREFKIGKAGKNVFFVDTKITTSGGRYYTPIDLDASQQAGFQILEENLAFSEQNDPYFRLDIKFGVKINSIEKKRSHQLYIDLQNVTNNDNIFGRRYNRLTNDINRVDQIGFFPDIGYRFQF